MVIKYLQTSLQNFLQISENLPQIPAKLLQIFVTSLQISLNLQQISAENFPLLFEENFLQFSENSLQESLQQSSEDMQIFWESFSGERWSAFGTSVAFLDVCAYLNFVYIFHCFRSQKLDSRDCQTLQSTPNAPGQDFFVTGKGKIDWYLQYIQSSAVITRSNLSRYYTRQGNNGGRNWIRYQNHNRHSIPRPHGRAMGCLLWGFWRKSTAL